MTTRTIFSRRPNFNMRLLLSAVLAALGACGGRQVGADEDTTVSEADTGEADTGDETDMGGESETGDPPMQCDLCAEDELCVAQVLSGDCGFYFGGTTCVPNVPSCDEDVCSQDCVDVMCGPSSQCGPTCDASLGVDLWCGPAFVDECDPLAQDCPEGEKCVAYASGNGSWDANKCVLVMGDNGVGEPCESAGASEGTDNCDDQSWCFPTQGYFEGTCYGFCGPETVCPDGQTCLVSNEGSINVCLNDCTPLQPSDCSDSEACAWSDGGFSCIPGVATLEPDAPCQLGDVCASGQTCVSATMLDSCDAANCCTDYCYTDQPDTCAPPHACQPLFEQGQAPAGFEDAGACMLP